MSKSYRRTSALAATAAALVLLPAGSALADETDPMNGMGCVHASGEGPDSLAAAGPGEGAAPQRAPSEAPIAPVSSSAGRSTSSSPASKPVSHVTKPVTQQVSKPATQVPAQEPATTTTQVMTTAAATVTTSVKTTVATPTRVERPRVKRVTHSARKRHRAGFERRFNGLEPKMARLSANLMKPLIEPKPVAPANDPPTGVIAFAVIGLAGLAGVAAIARRRRGTDGAIVPASPEAPVAPARADALVEAELQELIAEEKARADRPRTPA